ncbi:MAG: hypothetical protein ABRQ25_14640 [Clostridiaceae bacterium]
MKIKNLLIVFLISIFTFAEIPQARQLKLADTYKAGTHDLSEYAGYYTTIKLTTSDKPVTIIVVDPVGRIKYSMSLEHTNEIIKKGIVEKGDTMIILGPGEVQVSHTLE